ncbi:LCP family protein [Streptomyces sp. Qhu-G9]|uniref:LCP family protein n=1 Tax=Streptomyces sp. Qhu-G9 TaxID=3452799 RepID=UPI0022AC0F7A|nr:LCP family protein [Streptomyces aurantiacus]WAU83969.1 LCP family protein [Streptomyces aurantiacus]
MNDGTHHPAGHDRSTGVAEPARPAASRAGRNNSAPPSTRTAPLPGMPSPATPGRTGDGSRPRRAGGGRSPKPRPTGRRRAVRLAVLLLVVLLASTAGTYLWADTKLDQEVDLGALPDRPEGGRGTNYLIVGSDSRDGLSERDRQDLRTGSAEGRRTDSMILLHTGANGTTMLSLPRDSWVTIPPYVRPETGRSYRAEPNKLNAAFSLGGPDLLVRAVERNTGLHVDHYAEIGFAGFVGVVDAVGGVDMCLERDIRDDKSGADLRKGCQTLDGGKALAFVRQRKQEAEGDLGRTRNQQKFLTALAAKAVTPGTLLNPARSFPTLSAGLDTLVVDKDTDLRDLMSLFQAMRGVTAGGGRQINVPVSDPGFATSKGSAVKWDDRRARTLFTELRDDRPVTLPQGK